MALLEIENLSFSYPESEKRVLDNVSFSLERGDFLLVCGATGSGKSTLLRCLKRELTPLGALSGRVLYGGKPLDELPDRESARLIGFVGQRPEQQLVTDKVWHELAFGLENLGAPSSLIRRRVAETAAYFDLEDYFEREVSSLSGGQKQLVNLAAVMAMRPEVLLLDEPTAQLDPIAAESFLSTLEKLNRELSLTIVLIEHRLEEALPLSNRLLALENGKALVFDETRRAARALREHPVLSRALPGATRLSALLHEDDCPLTVREGRALLERRGGAFRTLVDEPHDEERAALAFRDVYFRYERSGADVLRGTAFRAAEGEITCLLGGNGSGKSTLLNCAAGLLRPYAGRVEVFGRPIRAYKGQALYQGVLALLPQDVQTMFLAATVREELKGVDYSAFPVDFEPLLDKHPYDLSGGEQQALGLIKALAAKPRLLLLDEPTKGLDARARDGVADILKALRARGLSIVCVTHDVEFAAACADQCALFFRGDVVSMDRPRAFFGGNAYYVPAAGRMARGLCEGALTVEELAAMEERA